MTNYTHIINQLAATCIVCGADAYETAQIRSLNGDEDGYDYPLVGICAECDFDPEDYSD